MVTKKLKLSKLEMNQCINPSILSRSIYGNSSISPLTKHSTYGEFDMARIP